MASGMFARVSKTEGVPGLEQLCVELLINDEVITMNSKEHDHMGKKREKKITQCPFFLILIDR